MGITASYLKVPADRLDEVMEAPSVIEMAVSVMDAPDRDRWFKGEGIDWGKLEDEGFDRTDLDKTWEALHFLLTGRTAPRKSVLSYAIFGSHCVDGDWTYAYLTPDDVGEVDRALSKWSENDLRIQYNPSVLQRKGVYPGCWNLVGEEEFRHLLDAFHRLRRFYSAAARNHMAVVVHIE